ncbi:MAG: hypothetical protein KIS75_09245, partial [Chromatiales bacterium]|nr:hypothetical protein [Chromatiales bacterium]
MALYDGTGGNDTSILDSYNIMYGKGGNDVLMSSYNSLAIIEGGTGNDAIGVWGADGAIGHLYGGYGDDMVMGHLLNDSLYGGEGNDFIIGGRFANYTADGAALAQF